MNRHTNTTACQRLRVPPHRAAVVGPQHGDAAGSSPNLSGADPALVPAASSHSAVSRPSGFDPGEFEQLIAEVDAASAACPVRWLNGPSYRYQDCPKCGSTPSHPCGPVSGAEYRVVEAVRAALKARAAQ